MPLPVTRFMWFAFQVMVLFISGFCLVVWIESKRPDKDNAALYVIIFGFITTNVGLMWNKAVSDKNQDSLNRQDIVLEHVREKVNGGTTKLVETLRQEHAAAISKLAEEARVARHDFKNTIHNLQLHCEHLETENKSLREQLGRSNPGESKT